MSAMILLTLFSCFGVLNVEAATAKVATSAHMAMSSRMGTQMGTAAQMKTEATLSAANPVRKVVKILQNMKETREQEQKDDKKTYDDYICGCIAKGVKIEHEIEEFKDKEEGLDADIKQGEADKNKDQNTINKDMELFHLDEDDIKKAVALNKEQEAAYQAEKKALDENIAAITDAIRALERGLSASFLQSASANVLRQLINSKDSDLSLTDKDALTSFLDNDGTYAPTSREIFGIMKELKDQMIDDLGKLMHENELRSKLYNAFIKNKYDDEEFLKSEIDKYMKRLAEEGIKLAEDRGYHSDVYDALLTDEEWLQRLHQRCHDWKADYILRERDRRKELVALNEAIEMLEGDHARELFRRTFTKSAESLIQLQQGSAGQRRLTALQLLHKKLPKAGNRHPQVDLLLIALRSGKISMERIIEKVYGLVGVLKKEQKDDDEKKVWCGDGMIAAHGELKLQKETIEQLKTDLEVKKQRVVTLNEEIESMYKRLKNMDEDVAKATKERQEQNTAYLAKISSNNAARSILNMAINKLNKYYNEDEYHNTIGMSLNQYVPVRESITTPPPMAVDDHQVKSGGVIGLLKEIITDLDLETQAMKTSEEDAQKEYEDYILDQKKFKEDAVKMITDRQVALGDAEKDELKYTQNLQTAQYELEDNEKYLASMKIECEFLLQYYDFRREARNQEIDSLMSAAAVLKGEEFESLIQTERSVTRLRGAAVKP